MLERMRKSWEQKLEALKTKQQLVERAYQLMEGLEDKIKKLRTVKDALRQLEGALDQDKINPDDHINLAKPLESRKTRLLRKLMNIKLQLLTMKMEVPDVEIALNYIENEFKKEWKGLPSSLQLPELDNNRNYKSYEHVRNVSLSLSLFFYKINTAFLIILEKS